MSCHKVTKSGFTFLEIVVSLLVLSVGALSMLQTINVAMNANYRAQQEVIASNLASSLLFEIMSKGFEEPGTEGSNDLYIGCEPQLACSETRSSPVAATAFDDVDDYDSNESELPGGVFDNPPATVGGYDMDGEQLPGGGGIFSPNYQGFSRSVNVEHVECSGSPCVYIQPGPPYAWRDTKRITVTVNGPGVTNFQMEGIVQ